MNEDEEPANHLIYEEGEDGMVHFRAGCTRGGCLVILAVTGIIILLIVLHRTGVI